MLSSQGPGPKAHVAPNLSVVYCILIQRNAGTDHRAAQDSGALNGMVDHDTVMPVTGTYTVLNFLGEKLNAERAEVQLLPHYFNTPVLHQ
jgi:hypothetical protein